MKRLIKMLPIIAILVLCMFVACKKENNPSRVATISTPTITLNGPLNTTINRGATWVDPGATWKDTVTGESGTVYAVIISPNYTLTKFVPNTSVDTAYLLNYIALNKNGFPSAVLTRGLGVTNMGNSIDISGNYTDNNGNVDSIYKVSRALFYSPAADAQAYPPYGFYGNPSVICIKSDSTICVATLYTSLLTAAYIPEWFTNDTISYASPIRFHYIPNLLNVPPGSGSAFGLPMGQTVTFTHN